MSASPAPGFGQLVVPWGALAAVAPSLLATVPDLLARAVVSIDDRELVVRVRRLFGTRTIRIPRQDVAGIRIEEVGDTVEIWVNVEGDEDRVLPTTQIAREQAEYLVQQIGERLREIP